MSNVDNRIVNMEFNNAEFEKRIKQTMLSLESLDKSLNVEGSAKSFSALSNSVESISDRFSALGVIGLTALQELTKSAINLGSKLISSLVNPILTGGKTRATNIEQAKFQFKGLGMDVEATMADADYAVSGTAYSLDAAAKVASMLGASGMRAGEQMRTSLRAISGVAAMAGSSYEDIGNVFTKVAGQGRVMGDDLLRLSARGINAAATIAQSLGISEAAVRDMVSDGAINFDMFSQAMDSAFGEHATAANETFTGAMSNIRSALARIGAKFYTPFHDNMIGPLNAFRVAINDVNKALDPMFQALEKWMVKTGPRVVKWIESWDFTGLEKAMPILVSIISNAVKIFQNIGREVGRVFGAITKAFQEVFPPFSLTIFASIIEKIKELTSSFGLTETAVENINRIFRGLFAVVKVVAQGIGLLAVGAAQLVKTLNPFAEKFLEVAAIVGDFAFNLAEAVSSGYAIEFVLGHVRAALDRLGVVGEWIRDIFGGIGSTISRVLEKLSISTEKFRQQLTPVKWVTEAMSVAFGILEVMLRSIDPILRGIGETVAKVFGTMKDWFGRIISGDAQIGKLTFGVGAVYILGEVIKEAALHLRWLGQAIKDNFAFLGFKETKTRLDQVLGNLTGSLRHMQDNIRADTLVKIATGVLILAGAITLLSTIDVKKLGPALAAVSLLFAEMMASIAFLGQITTKGGAMKLAGLQTIALTLSASLLILASAAKKMSELDWEGVAKGTAGVLGMITSLVLAIRGLTTTKGAEAQLLTGATTLIGLAAAVRILADAVEKIGRLDIDKITIGLIAIGVILVELAAFTRLAKAGGIDVSTSLGLAALAASMLIFGEAITKLGRMNTDVVKQGVKALGAVLLELALFTKIAGGTTKMISIGTGLTIVAASLLIFNKVIRELGRFNQVELIQGLSSLGVVLGLLFVSMQLMPKNMPAIGAGLVLVAGSVMALTAAIGILGKMETNNLIRGLAALAGALTAVALGATIMEGSMGGAVATTIMAAAIMLLVPSLVALGSLPTKTIVKGLATLAGAFIVLGAAGIVLQAAVIPILGLAASLVLIGVAMVGIGAGVTALATAFTVLAGSGLALGTVLTAALHALIGLIPALFAAIAQGFVQIVSTISESITEIADSIKTMVVGMLDMLIELIPKVMETVSVAIGSFLALLIEHIPAFVETAVLLVNGFLQVIIEATPKFVEAITGVIHGLFDVVINSLPKFAELIGQLIDTGLAILTENLPKFVQAGFDILIGFLGGIRDNIEKVTEVAVDIIVNFLNAITKEFPKLVQTGVDTIVAFINALADAVRDNYEAVVDAALNLIGAFIEAIVGTFKKLVEKGWEIVKNTLSGIKDAVFGNKKDTEDEGKGIVSNVLTGITNFLRKAFDKGWELIKEILKGIRDAVIDAVEWLFEKGQEIVSNVIEGIKDWFKNLFEKGKEVVSNVVGGIAAGVTSFAGSLWDNGKKIVTNVIDGIGGWFSNLFNKGKEIGKTASDGAKKGVSDSGKSLKTSGESLGKNLIEGAKVGISNMASSLRSTATRVFQGAVTAANRTFQVASPSKVTERLGKWFVLGFVNQLKDMGHLVWTTAANTGHTMIDGLEDGVSDVPDIFDSILALLDDDPNITPTITPVLDLDDVSNAWAQFAYAGLPIGITTMKAQQAAKGASANDILSYGKAGSNESVEYNITVGGSYTIREEADIKKVSEELAREIERKRRG